MIEHLVTSGCSFSDNVSSRWPLYLSEKLNCKLYNYGIGSAGNNWICESAIYQVVKLMNQGIDPSTILVCVMWSGIDRLDDFISNSYSEYATLANYNGHQPNPASFVYTEPNEHPSSEYKLSSGWLLGSLNCAYANHKINEHKSNLITKFWTEEKLMLSSINNWLKLQWFCQANNIKLINTTYMNLWYYPDNSKSEPFYRTYNDNVGYLYKILDLESWIFTSDNYDGMYEWTINNNLPTYSDNVHPAEQSHRLFAEVCLYNKIREKYYEEIFSNR
jgi:hypothetical protein